MPPVHTGVLYYRVPYPRLAYPRLASDLNLFHTATGMTTPTPKATPMSQENNRWGNLALLRLNAFGFGINGMGSSMDAIILPALTLVFVSDHLKNTYLGILGFTGLALAALVQLGIGSISDRVHFSLGRRVPFILWGAALVCLGLVGVGLAPNYAVLFAAWLLIQGSINIGYGPYQALIQDLVPTGRVGRAASYKILSDATGALVLIFVSGELIGFATGSELSFWLWLTLGILGASLVVTAGITSSTVLARERARPETAPVARAARSGPLPRLHPQLTRFVVSRLMLVVAIAAFQTFGLFFLRDVVELDNPAQALGRMILIIGGGLAVSVYLSGWVSDRVGRKPVVFAGALGAAVSTIWMLTANDAGQVLVIASAIGFSVGALLSANWALANDMGTSGREALHMGIINLANIGGAGVAKLMGPGIDLLNRLEPTVHILGYSHTVTGYSAMLIGCGVLFLSGALLLLPLKANIRENLPSGQLPPTPA